MLTAQCLQSALHVWRVRRREQQQFITLRCPIRGPHTRCASDRNGAQPPSAPGNGAHTYSTLPRMFVPRPLPPKVAELPVAPPKPRVKPAGPPPEPVPVQHSTAFLLNKGKTQQQQEGVPGIVPMQRKPRLQQQDEEEEPFSGNAVQYWLKKADESLDEIEDSPPEAAKVLYKVSRSPVGNATAKGVEIVAKVGYAVGKEAVKVAVPAAGQVAKWALQQGARAAMGAVQTGLRNSLDGGDKSAAKSDKKSMQEADSNGKGGTQKISVEPETEKQQQQQQQ